MKGVQIFNPPPSRPSFSLCQCLVSKKIFLSKRFQVFILATILVPLVKQCPPCSGPTQSSLAPVVVGRFSVPAAN